MRNSNGLNGMRERALLRYLVVRDVYALHMVPKRNTRCSGTYIRIPIPWRHSTGITTQIFFFFAILQLVRPGPALSIFLEYLLFQEYSFLLWKPRTVLGFVLKQQGQRHDVAVADAPMKLVGVGVH